MSDILAFDIDSYMMGLVRIDLDPEEKARRLIARITTVDIAAQTTITRKLIVLATFDCGATPEGIEKDALTQPKNKKVVEYNDKIKWCRLGDSNT